MKYLNAIYIIVTLLVCATGCGPDHDLKGIESQIKNEETKLVPGTACLGENDKKHMFGENIEFAKNVDRCVEKSWNAHLRKSDFKAIYPQMSDGCIDCFDRLVKCSAANCSWDCGIAGTADSPNCEACNKLYCHLKMFQCSGIPSADVPSLRQK